jgi:glycerol dehydrogenase-like iron-containing ADH family enzyme
MQDWLDRILLEADEIRNVTKEGIKLIMQAFEDISLICRRFGSSRPQEASDHAFAYNAEFQTGKQFLHGELVALGSYVMTSFQGNDTTFLNDVYRNTGLIWQPKDIGLTRDEFIKTMSTLNWYQKSFGRRYSILDERQIDQEFLDKIIDQLQF